MLLPNDFEFLILIVLLLSKDNFKAITKANQRFPMEQ